MLKSRVYKKINPIKKICRALDLFTVRRLPLTCGDFYKNYNDLNWCPKQTVPVHFQSLSDLL